MSEFKVCYDISNKQLINANNSFLDMSNLYKNQADLNRLLAKLQVQLSQNFRFYTEYKSFDTSIAN